MKESSKVNQAGVATHEQVDWEHLRVPDPVRLDKVQELCDLTTPYAASSELDTLFIEAMVQAVAWHRERCPAYHQLLKQSGFREERAPTIASWSELPTIPANFFKRNVWLSIPEEEVSVHLTSSGTTGQKSQIFFDEWSIRSAQRMISRIFEFRGWLRPEQPTNYLLFNYEPRPEQKIGTSYTANFLCSFAPAKETFYALRWAGGTEGHRFDAFGAVERLRRFAEQQEPVRIMGIPAFFYFTLQQMVDLGLPPLRLHPDSLVFTAGGWKGHTGKAIGRREFHDLIAERLGLASDRITDGYGSTEHSIPYIADKYQEMRVPIWSRAFVRDYRTLKPLPYGEVGFLSFITPYITSVPALSVTMGDAASLHAPEEAGDDLPTEFFRIRGRAGVSKNRSCAVAAAELLQKGR